MSPVREGFHGRLDLAKRKREIIPALLMNAPLRDDELHIPLQFRFNDHVPVIISYHEYYRFLHRLVTSVLQEDIVRLVLVRVKMPSVIPLPRSLLDPRVAIFYDIEAESRELSTRGKEHLCVDANFKLYSWSAGDNTISVRWISPRSRKLPGESLEKIREVIGTLPAAFEYVDESVNRECDISCCP
jgi:hypothetical protein